VVVRQQSHLERYVRWRQRLKTEYADRIELHTCVVLGWRPQWRYANGAGVWLGVTVGFCLSTGQRGWYVISSLVRTIRISAGLTGWHGGYITAWQDTN